VHLELMRDPSRTFPTVAEPELVLSARVWHCKYKGLSPLAQLRNLEELVIAGFPDDSFEFFSKLENCASCMYFICQRFAISDRWPN